MAAPKRKPEATRAPVRPTPTEHEDAEDRADAEELTKATAEWEANGRPSVKWDEAKRQLGLK